MTKIGRNDSCPCDSGKKYKKCCLGKDIQHKAKRRERIIYGDEVSSKLLGKVVDTLKATYTDHECIDVSGVLEESSYRPLQVQHYKAKMIMVAERSESSESVFEERCAPEFNVMVMYRGAYNCLCVDPEQLDDIICHK